LGAFFSCAILLYFNCEYLNIVIFLSNIGAKNNSKNDKYHIKTEIIVSYLRTF
jgi:hypothetical protein